MAVGDAERAFGQAVRSAGFPIEPGESEFTWLTGRGHLGSAVDSVPTASLDALKSIHEVLGGDADALAAKPERRLRPDFRIGADILVEFDEEQHFTTARRRSLAFYEEVESDLKIDEYRRLCDRLSSYADRYRQSKDAADFPFPGGRQAQRAYLDAVRDLLARHFGFRLVRVPYVRGGVPAAVDYLVRQLA